jgi:hypothetical protein
MSKKRNFADLKKRVADCLTAMHGVQINESMLRLWKMTGEVDKLVTETEKVAGGQSASDMSMTTETAKQEQSEEIEQNSGVQFPGDSLEPLLSVPITLEDDTFDEGCLVVEYKQNPESGFVF